MSNDSDKFVRDRELIDRGYKKNWIYYEKDDERYIPLCEGKTFYILDSRYNHIAEDGNGTNCTAQEKSDPRFFPKTRYFVKESECEGFYSSKQWDKEWAVVLRNVARSSDRRTFVSSLSQALPFGNSAPLVLSERPSVSMFVFSSHLFDFIVRAKVQGINLNFSFLYRERREDILQVLIIYFVEMCSYRVQLGHIVKSFFLIPRSGLYLVTHILHERLHIV